MYTSLLRSNVVEMHSLCFYTLYFSRIFIEYISFYISGPNLPLGLARHAMVTSPTGKGAIAMGGISSGWNSNSMFELTQSMEWTRLEQTLQIGHYVPLTIPIPDELVSKQD